ncbi:signal recognition particle-docking protein FtsY [Lactobacillus sp. ESL0228]|uniref:signal recognition particle-docking protein FtsY n=1 Tax=Lactobacillus sp. ESL0228 TaxID=2069352 RepID=UPI000EFA9765|nr:signal recognition particle-docking protein FtsY [Lactobacillus sp. ESL0228]RMC48989.1 signal recognition particle-docking protein FtsY [Lactobacillus sp. ESL0228]
MGLFDKIKKSLFGNNDDETAIKKTATDQKENTEEIDQDVKTVSSDEKSGKNLLLKQTETDKESSSLQDHQPNGDNKFSEKTTANNTSQETIVDEKKSDKNNSQVQETASAELYEKGLEKTNKGFGSRLNQFFAKFRTVDEDFFDDLEELLIESDVGYETAETLTDELRDEAKLQNAKSRDDLKKVIVEKLVDLYDQNGDAASEKLRFHANDQPTIYLFVGVNGAGKTTTIGKLAKRFKDQGKSVILAAADTFRAGAVEQLVEWGKRVNAPVVTGKEQADPASVVYDATSKALAEHVDYLLVDTAGRLQNKKNLMNELEKIERTIKKLAPNEPTETLLVLDGSTGQNALLQAKDFDKSTKLTGLVLTKLDGSSKGGVVLAIRNEMKLPVKLVGLGEKASDLADFDAANYAVGLFHDLI